MDAASVLKRKGAEAAAPWVDGIPIPATKIRRLDAEVTPVGPAGLPPPQQQQNFGVEAARISGGVAAPAVDATALLKRKGAEAPQPWLDVDGVPLPATKIRRLDAEVPPVIASSGAIEPPQPFVVTPPAAAIGVAAPAVNDERAIVVYQPAEAARTLLQGPLRPGASFRVSPDWIHGLKSTMLQEASNHRALFEELAGREENLNLALVPWAPAQVHAHDTSSAAATAEEMMDADHDGDGASMEVESQPTPPAGGALQGEVFHQQQQQQQQHQWPPQHCVAPEQLQLPAASYQQSPVTWSW